MSSKKSNNCCGKYKKFEFILYCFIMLVVFILGTTLDAKGQTLKKAFRFSTFYVAASGGNSVADNNVYSVTNGLNTSVETTPFDYSLTLGIRKIARFGYENRATVFYNGTERSYSDAATIGKVKGFEYLLEADWIRQQGRTFFNQDYFVRYVGKNWVAKVEYLEDNIADISYFEGSQRGRINLTNKLSINAGLIQRVAEPYGYDPLEEWVLETNDIHYTSLALQEGYTMNVNTGEFFAPDGTLVAENTEVWEAVVIPEVLSDYADRKRSELPDQWQHSLVVGYDYYHFTDDFWLHSWGNLLPYHLDQGGEFSYHRFNNNAQWLDYSGGLIFGYRFNKSLGVFLEGKYHKYWSKTWYDFLVGMNYVIF